MQSSTNYSAPPRSPSQLTTGPSWSSSTRNRRPSTFRPLLSSGPLRGNRGSHTTWSGAPTLPSLRRDPGPTTRPTYFSRLGAPYAPSSLPRSCGNNTKYVISSRSNPGLKKGTLHSFLPPSGIPPGILAMIGPPFFPPPGSWSSSGAPCVASIAVNMGSFQSPPLVPTPSSYWWSPWSFPPICGAPWINPGASAPPHPSAWMHPLAPPFGPPLMGPGPPPTPFRSCSEALRNDLPPSPPSGPSSSFWWGLPGISEWNPATWSLVPSWGRTSWGAALASATSEERRPLLNLDPETPSGPSPLPSPLSLPPPHFSGTRTQKPRRRTFLRSGPQPRTPVPFLPHPDPVPPSPVLGKQPASPGSPVDDESFGGPPRPQLAKRGKC